MERIDVELDLVAAVGAIEEWPGEGGGGAEVDGVAVDEGQGKFLGCFGIITRYYHGRFTGSALGFDFFWCDAQATGQSRSLEFFISFVRGDVTRK